MHGVGNAATNEPENNHCQLKYLKHIEDNLKEGAREGIETETVYEDKSSLTNSKDPEGREGN